MRVEGQQTRLPAVAARVVAHGAQQRLVAAVDAVEVADGQVGG
jgi:hypothetical protein